MQICDPFILDNPNDTSQMHPNNLLEGNETGRVGGADTGSSVLDWSVRDREFGQVVTNHFRLDFDLVELLSGVDTDDAANHFWDNDHISQVSLDQVRFLVWLSLLLGLAELLDETHRLALQTAVESTASTSVDNIAKLVGGEVEELVEVDSTVGKLAECSLCLDLGS